MCAMKPPRNISLVAPTACARWVAKEGRGWGGEVGERLSEVSLTTVCKGAVSASWRNRRACVTGYRGDDVSSDATYRGVPNNRGRDSSGGREGGLEDVRREGKAEAKRDRKMELRRKGGRRAREEGMGGR